jgi:hypothetical protein
MGLHRYRKQVPSGRLDQVGSVAPVVAYTFEPVVVLIAQESGTPGVY